MNLKKCVFNISLALLLSPALSLAQLYLIDWYQIGGGGGASLGGVNSVSGTIGQHDVGQQMAGGNYTLNGGSWALYALQTPDSPVLRGSLIATNTAIVSWPSPSTGFLLQQNPGVASTNWSNFAGIVNDDGVTRSVTISIRPGVLFFRLRKQDGMLLRHDRLERRRPGNPAVLPVF